MHSADDYLSFARKARDHASREGNDETRAALEEIACLYEMMATLAQRPPSRVKLVVHSS